MEQQNKSEKKYGYEGQFAADEVEESKEGTTAQQIKLARRGSKMAKLSEVLRRNSTLGSS